jgi:hypothetical protein
MRRFSIYYWFLSCEEVIKMPIGRGKYDEQCTKIREETHAEGVFLAVFSGDQGMGFSVQAPFELLISMPAILRDVANQVEESIKSGHA